jgi:small subunit ribosomal protein S3
MAGAEISSIFVKKTPLGDKITIASSKPGMIVGKKGANIFDLTTDLKQKFSLENPQIEINEVGNPFLDANIVADMMVRDFENFGSMRFKQIGNRTVDNVMRAGALGVEIKLSGKIPSARAKSWRFYSGYLKKSGEAAAVGIRSSIKAANLKAGTIGVQVMIMPPEMELPDRIFLKEDLPAQAQQQKPGQAQKEEKKEEKKAEQAEEKKPEGEKPKKRGRKKKTEQPDEAKEEVKEEAKEEPKSE